MRRLFGFGKPYEWPPKKEDGKKKDSEGPGAGAGETAQGQAAGPPPKGALQVYTNPPAEGATDRPAKSEEPVKLDSVDILAFTIAMFQVIIPYLLVLIGAVLAVYGLFWLLFRH